MPPMKMKMKGVPSKPKDVKGTLKRLLSYMKPYKARLILVACDAGDHSWRRAKSFVAGTEQLCMKVPYTKDRLGEAVGRTSLAMAAFTDPALALAFVKALDDPETHKEALESLEKRTRRVLQRQQEEKNHQRNLRQGRKTGGKREH